MKLDYNYVELIAGVDLETCFDCLKPSSLDYIAAKEWFEEFQCAEVSALKLLKFFGFVIVAFTMKNDKTHNETRLVVLNTNSGIFSVEYPSGKISPFTFENAFSDPGLLSVAIFHPSNNRLSHCFYLGKWISKRT